MIAGRSEIVEQFWSGSLALMFRLPRNGFLVGYALGEDGMLFVANCLGDAAKTMHAVTL
jgi:hypothetical protein